MIIRYVRQILFYTEPGGQLIFCSPVVLSLFQVVKQACFQFWLKYFSYVICKVLCYVEMAKPSSSEADRHAGVCLIKCLTQIDVDSNNFSY